MRQWLNLLAGTCIVAPGAAGQRPAQAADLIVRASMGSMSAWNRRYTATSKCSRKRKALGWALSFWGLRATRPRSNRMHPSFCFI